MRYNDFYWKHNDCLNKDTSLAHSFGEKVWKHQQQKIDELNNQLLMLQKRIDDTEKWIEENKKWIALGHWDGWTDEQYVDADDLIEVLKGEQK